MQILLTRAKGIILVLSIGYHFWITFSRQYMYLHFAIENESFILLWNSLDKLWLIIQLVTPLTEFVLLALSSSHKYSKTTSAVEKNTSKDKTTITYVWMKFTLSANSEGCRSKSRSPLWFKCCPHWPNWV